jgi:two-component system, LytTR family, response regulator
VRINEISVFESGGNYTRVFFGSGRPLIYRSLNSLEARLDPRHFFRASRKHIINLAKVQRIEPWFGSSLLVHLQGDHKIEMSRRQRSKISRVAQSLSTGRNWLKRAPLRPTVASSF